MAGNKEVPMHRLAARLLCALAGGLAAAAAGGLLAAPAPFPRPTRERGPWFDGWDRPIDPRGDCQFNRKGDRLTITVPGKGHEFDVENGRLTAPRLLREVEGDFIVQVRLATDHLTRVSHAGLVLMSERRGAMLGLGIRLRDDSTLHVWQASFFDLGGNACTTTRDFIDLPGKACLLGLERSGQTILIRGNPDGKGWKTWDKSDLHPLARLPRRVKVGVFVEVRSPSTFQAVFDDFKLTSLGGPDGPSPVRPR
jgi:regulation of enolase protein 1 (concanavalin A-like superfamily)